MSQKNSLTWFITGCSSGFGRELTKVVLARGYRAAVGAIKDPQSFIHPVPHMSFVRGSENVAFLKKRFEALSAHPCYHGMEYSADKMQIRQWIPLVMEGRDPKEIVAATRMRTGTDVDYGALTKDLLDSVKDKVGFSIHYSHRVQDLRRDGDLWGVRVRNEKTGEHWDVQASPFNMNRLALTR